MTKNNLQIIYSSSLSFHTALTKPVSSSSNRYGIIYSTGLYLVQSIIMLQLELNEFPHQSHVGTLSPLPQVYVAQYKSLMVA